MGRFEMLLAWVFFCYNNRSTLTEDLLHNNSCDKLTEHHKKISKENKSTRLTNIIIFFLGLCPLPNLLTKNYISESSHTSVFGQGERLYLKGPAD